MLNIFDELKSNVRSYCREYPTLFTKSKGSLVYNSDNERYIDFFSGAGALNYGHNHPIIKSALMDYIENDGIAHALDMATSAKAIFIDKFHQHIRRLRKLIYKLQFTGPTDTDAIEAAIKLARKITKRTKIISFTNTNAFHGMTLGALAVTGSSKKRMGAGIPLAETIFIPYENYFNIPLSTAEMLDIYFNDPSSVVEPPAAIILETIQAEGWINVASNEWLQAIQKVAHKHKILLIIDDIQAGCSRTGKFFSFEDAGLYPNIVCLSKSLSGYGLPLSLVLIKPEYDIWQPGEHNGTFQGNNLAFITAASALDFWINDRFISEITEHATYFFDLLHDITCDFPDTIMLRGRGFIYGIEFKEKSLVQKVKDSCFQTGLLIETSDFRDEVLKFLPAINISNDILNF